MMVEDAYMAKKGKKRQVNKPINNNIVGNEYYNAIILENEKEKIFLGKQLYNNLIQVLSSLNFYIDAIQQLKNKNTKLNLQFLNNIKNLGQNALEISYNTANSLMSTNLSEDKGLLNAIQNHCKRLKGTRFIKITVEMNLNESDLSLEKKQKILSISNDILLYLVSINTLNRALLKYTLKYRKRILQIEVTLKKAFIHITDLEKVTVVGYNNLQHSLDLLGVNITKKTKDNNTHLIIKLPLTD